MYQVTLDDVTKDFQGPAGNVIALGGISLNLQKHDFVAIVGPSGCGKTTILKLLAGILKPTAGSIRYGWDKGSSGRIALAFQDHGLFPWMTVEENVCFGLEACGVSRGERIDRSRAMLESFRIGEFAHHYPHQLSGGMRQRTGLARAFLINPDLLLLDEPFASVDAQTRLHLQDELLAQWARTESTVIYVTHDIEEAILLSDRVIVLSSRPGKVKSDYSIPFPRPRSLIGRDEPDIKDLKWRIWQNLD